MDKFNRVIGYAENEDVNSEKLLGNAKVLQDLLKNILPEQKVDNILIAGCGNGDEAIAFQHVFNQHVTGVDINLHESRFVDNDKIKLFKADLSKLPFEDHKFSFIYCYHVLEHVDEPKVVLQELKRVLNNNGVIFIGFPNRRRLGPSYFSSNLKISLLQILKYNFRDYWYKLTGRFRNEYGAHAGFSEKEFIKMAAAVFTEVLPIREKRIEFNYTKYAKIFKIAKKLRFDDVLYPSNYYFLKK